MGTNLGLFFSNVGYMAYNNLPCTITPVVMLPVTCANLLEVSILSADETGEQFS